MTNRVSTLAPTRYEIVLESTDGRAYLCCYTQRKSRPGLRHAILGGAIGKAIAAVAGMSDQATIRAAGKASDGLILEDPMMSGVEWRIRFSGRTQRDAINTGRELPFVVTVARTMTQAA